MRFIHSQLARAAAVVAGSVLVVLVSGCNRQEASSSDQEAQASASQTPTVKVVHPERKDVRRYIERPAYNIEAYERAPLYAKIAGYVLKWNVDMGDTVRKDQILAELYIPEMEVELKQKQAAVGQTAAEIKQAEAAVLRAQAELKHAEAQYERLARVGRAGVVDKEQVDETRFGFEAAQAAVAKAQADVDVAKARHRVAEADQDRLQTLLQYTKVRAPFDGAVTGRRSISIGDFVQPGDAGKKEWLFVVERINPVRVFVNVQEWDAAAGPAAVWVRHGDAALIRVQGLPGQEFKGKVTRISKSMNPQNHTLLTQIDLPNDDGKLLPGMFANPTIIAEHKNVWTLPLKAVLTQGDQTYCYRVENGKAVRTRIQIGMRGNEPDNERVEVLKKQARPAKANEKPQWEDFNGDEVVASDAASLSDGQAVRVPVDK